MTRAVVLVSKFSNIGMRGLMLAGLFAQGLCLAFFLQSNDATQPSDPTEPPSVGSPTSDESLAVSNMSSLAHREIAEEFLKANDSVKALPHLLNAAPKKLNDADLDLKLRIALCWEASKNFTRAADLYRVLYTQSDDSHIATQARIGFARCKIRIGDTEPAKQILWRMLQNSDGEIVEPWAEADTAFWLATAYNDNQAKPFEEKLSPNYLVRTSFPVLDVAKQLETVTNWDAQKSDRTKASDVSTADKDENRLSNRETIQPSTMVVSNVISEGSDQYHFAGSFFANQFNLFDAFRRLQSEYPTEMKITDRAAQLAQQHFLSLSLPNVGFFDCLDAMTQPYGLGYQEFAGGVSIFSLKESNDAVLSATNRAVANRLLHRAELISQNEQQFGYARFLRANSLAEQGRLDEASAVYTDLMSRKIDLKLRQSIHFNLGQIAYQINQNELAIQNFGRVSDSSFRIDLQSLALLKVGQVNIADTNFDQASLYLARSAAISESNRIRTVAKLLLVSNHLLSGRPSLALQHTSSLDAVSEPLLKNPARFLAELTRFRQLDDEPTLEQKERLLATLSHLDWPEFLGSFGVFLMADAYWNLGFTHEAVDLLQKNANQFTSSKLGRSQLQQLINYLLVCGKYSELHEALRVASSIEGFNQGGQLSYRMADLAFREGEIEQCRTYCLEVLGNASAEEHHSDALIMLGQIYASRGEHNQASLCFAGLLPQLPRSNSNEEAQK